MMHALRPGHGRRPTISVAVWSAAKTYAVIAGGRPLMVVHEEFPATSVRDAA